MREMLWTVAEYSSISVVLIAVVYVGLYCVSGIIDKIKDIKGG